tara:strand:- start:1815 stop:2960 length:1146 start_codon:yes stop_codon:yes gene_type:complete
MDFSDIKHELKALSFKRKTNFSGSSPPEIFVGRHNYPNIYSGILSPIQYGDTEKFSSPERWYEKNLNIKEVIDYRKQLIYSRFKSKVKDVRTSNQLLSALNQVSLAYKSVDAQFTLHRPARFQIIKDNSIPIIGNPAPLKAIKLESNPKIKPKVDYLTNDNKLKANQGIQELYKSGTENSNIIKILSAGLLGLKSQRKLVPTRWAITATDDTISKEQLKKIRTFPQINKILSFHGEYLGNHYEILLLPDRWSYEVIEISHKGQAWQDHENFFPRKSYASNVVGGYYAVRIAITEYLLRKQKQATVLVFREVRPEYNAPLGVGILRQLTRDILTKQPTKFPNTNEALENISTRLQYIPIETYTTKSKLLSEFGKQRKITDWF